MHTWHCFSDYSHSWISISLRPDEVEHLFMCLLAICISSLLKNYFNDFKIELFVFLKFCNCQNSLDVVNIGFFPEMLCTNICFLSVSWLALNFIRHSSDLIALISPHRQSCACTCVYVQKGSMTFVGSEVGTAMYFSRN